MQMQSKLQKIDPYELSVMKEKEALTSSRTMAFS